MFVVICILYYVPSAYPCVLLGKCSMGTIIKIKKIVGTGAEFPCVPAQVEHCVYRAEYKSKQTLIARKNSLYEL